MDTFLTILWGLLRVAGILLAVYMIAQFSGMFSLYFGHPM